MKKDHDAGESIDGTPDSPPDSPNGLLRNICDYVGNPRKMSGVTCAMGDVTAFLMGDAAGMTAGVCSLTSAGIMMVCGDKPWGYSTATALMAVSEFSLALSPSVATNKALQASFIAMGALWSAGVLHAPLGDISKNLAENKPALAACLKNISEAIPPCVGGTSLMLRMPAVVSAVAGHNWAALGVTAAWGASDFLAGELHQNIDSTLKHVKTNLAVYRFSKQKLDPAFQAASMREMFQPKQMFDNKNHLIYAPPRLKMA